MKRALLLLPALAMTLVAERARAQNDGDVAAYVALIFTPVGGFAPRAGGALPEAGIGGVSLRYGRLSYEDGDATHMFGASGDVGAGSGRLGFTGGVATCDGCDAIIMVGADWTTPLVRRTSPSGTFGVGVTTAIGAGFSTEEDADGIALSGSLGLPLSLVAGNRDGLRAVPFVTPGIGFGTLTGDGGDSGVRPTLGAGIGIIAANGFGLSVGVQKVFIEGGEPVFGLTLTIGGR